MGMVKDLARGQRGVDLVAALLKGARLPVAPNPAKTKKDLKFFDIKGGPYKFEVKTDYFELFTGNIAVEYFNPRSNCPSGISVTEADFWVVVLNKPWSAWITSVRLLKDFISRNPAESKQGGDKGNSLMYLHKAHAILPEIFHRFDTLSPEELGRLLESLWST